MGWWYWLHRWSSTDRGAPPARDTPTDTTDVEAAIARAKLAHVDALEATARVRGRWPRIEGIIDLAREIREENHLADDIRTVLGVPHR